MAHKPHQPFSDYSNHPISFNVGGRSFVTLRETFPQGTLFFYWFAAENGRVPFIRLEDGSYFIDRDPFCFGVILNYFRLRRAGQLWESCLPKDPDRLALLSQEAEYFQLDTLKEMAISLLQACGEKGDTAYVDQVLSKSASCPHGFRKVFDED